MTSRNCWSLLLALALIAASPPRTEKESVPLPVSPAYFPAPAWEGSQFLAASKKGEIFLLNPLSLEVFPGRTGSPAPTLPRFKPLPTQASSAPARRAAMSRDGDDWAILEGASIRLFRAGKEVAVSAVPWNPQAIAFQGTDLVALVLPEPIQPGTWSTGNPPLLLSWDGRRWNPLAEDEALAAYDAAARFSEKQRRAASVFADSERRLWVANLHRYRLRQFSPGGRLLTEIRVGRGQVQEVSAEVAASRKEEMQKELEAQGVPASDIAKGTFHVNTAKSVVVAMAEGLDARMYVLAHDRAKEGSGADLVLDRYDAALSTLERVRLALELPGHLSMAAGKDGLYLAAFHAGEAGRWFLPWEALEDATWAPVAEVEIGSKAP